MTTEKVEIDTSTLNGKTDEEDIVTPWDVATKNETGIDYDKLISEFHKKYLSQQALKIIFVIQSQNYISLFIIFVS